MIEKFLIEKGFTKDNNLYTKTVEQVVGKVVINGQHKNQIKTTKLAFEYIDTGWIGIDENDNVPLEGYAFSVDAELVCDFWVKDESDLNTFIKL